MERPQLELADVFRRYGSAYRQQHAGSLSRGQQRVMSTIQLCRSAALGGHLEECDSCGHQRPAYNSCRNRHCSKCQSFARAQWLEDRQAELLPVEYFHVVFTVPEEIATLAYQNKEVVYGILFRAVAEALRTIAADPKEGCFEVIAGRSVVAFRRREEDAVPSPKCFGFVQTYDQCGFRGMVMAIPK